MIYIVTGHMRSGTSMMMQALAAGGLTPAYDTRRDRLIEQTSDANYRANPESLFEIDFARYQDAGFPAAYESRLIKVFWWGLSHLTPGLDYRVVVMRRDPEEMRQSYAAMGARNPNGWTYPPHALADYDRRFTAMVAALSARLGATVEVCEYADVVADPAATFARLAAAGWPIDPQPAAAVVDPARYRFRLERLTVGI